jgi:hypothetical protein
MSHTFTSEIDEQLHDHATDHLVSVLLGFLRQAEEQGVCLHCVVPELMVSLAERYREAHGDVAALGLLTTCEQWLTDTPPEPDSPLLWNQEPAH